MANNPKDNRWSQPKQPPPPLFVGRAERDFVKQINDEVIEKVIGQQILYFPIDRTVTNYHPLYGEAIEKITLRCWQHSSFHFFAGDQQLCSRLDRIRPNSCCGAFSVSSRNEGSEYASSKPRQVFAKQTRDI